jgi:hypothetical protein
LSEFASGFVATRYLLGVRGPELLKSLDDEPYAAGRGLATALSHTDQRERAKALSAPLRALVRALEDRQLQR